MPPIIPLQTEMIDKLFLELSQFTQATTSKELALRVALGKIWLLCDQTHKRIDAGDVITVGDTVQSTKKMIDICEEALSERKG